ncbi:hypothetical protein Tco_0072221 [Tanacetum coccineum]
MQNQKKSEESEFEVADSDMAQDQEENMGNDDEEPKGKVASDELETASPIQRDAVTTNTKTASLDLTTASEYTT